MHSQNREKQLKNAHLYTVWQESRCFTVWDFSLIPLMTPWKITILFQVTNNFRGFCIYKIVVYLVNYRSSEILKNCSWGKRGGLLLLIKRPAADLLTLRSVTRPWTPYSNWPMWLIPKQKQHIPRLWIHTSHYLATFAKSLSSETWR